MARDGSMDEGALREAAIQRLRKRRTFFRHLVVYGLGVVLLIGVWAVAGAGFFWPIFPIVAWGLAVIYHAWTVFRNDDEEARIRREMDRLKKRA